jgi:iron complex outermembrane recepter protein
LETDTTLSDEVSVRFNYTYTDAEMVSGGFKGKEVPFLAKDTAVVIFLRHNTPQSQTK